jgi:hypothetical protein
MIRILLTLFALFSLSVATSQFSVLEISNFGYRNLERLKSSLKTIHASEWWIEVGDQLLTFSSYPSSTLAISRTTEPIFIVSKVHILNTHSRSHFDLWLEIHVSYLEGLNSKILLHNLGFAIIQADRETILSTLQRTRFPDEDKIKLFNFTNLVLASQLANQQEAQNVIPPSDTNIFFKKNKSYYSITK